MTPSIADIIAATADASHYSVEQLTGDRKFSDLAHWRACGMFLALKTGKSTTQVGNLFGGRDHTTVIYARRRIEAQTDPLTAERVAMICTRVAMRLASRAILQERAA
jgi:chromosomal replication initiator protein